MAEKVKLKRQLTSIHGVAIICGLIIGSGIFISPKAVLNGTHSVGMSLIVWVVGGIVSTLGALCFAEAGTTFPGSGEKYHYLCRTVGPFPGFLYMWSYLLLVRPGANAIKCLVFAKYLLEPLYPECDVPEASAVLIGVALACFLTALNCVNIQWALRTQTLFTALGICALALLTITGIVRMCQGDIVHLKTGFQGTTDDIASICLAVYAAIFSFGGSTLPRIIYISMSLVTLLYVGVNLSYLAVLGVQGVMTSQAVAVTFAQKTLGRAGSWVMPIFIALNAAGSFNSGTVVGSRLCFVGARAGHLPDALSLINIKTMSPMTSLVFQLIMVAVLMSSMKMYIILNNTVFVMAIFDALNIAGILWFRYKHPDLHRPIKMPSVVLVTFLVVQVILAAVPLILRPKDTVLFCVFVVITGVSYYVVFVVWKNKPTAYKLWVERQLIRIQKLFYSVKQEDYSF